MTSLYLRVVEPEDKSGDVEMLAFVRAVYGVQRGIDALDPQWQTMIVMALRQMDPSARAQIDGFNRTMRTLLDDAARDETPPSEKAPPEKDAEASGFDRVSRTSPDSARNTPPRAAARLACAVLW